MAFDGSRAEFYRQRVAEVRNTRNCRDLTIKGQLETVARQYEDSALTGFSRSKADARAAMRARASGAA